MAWSNSNRHYQQLLRQFRTIIMRWLWFLALCTVLAGAGAYVGSKAIHPVYKATALLIVNAQGASDSTYTGLLASDQLVSTYKTLITQPIVLQKAASALKGETETSLQQKLVIADDPGTQLILVSVNDNSASQAATIANAVANAFVSVQQEQSDTQYLATQQQLAQQLAQADQQVTSLTSQIAALQSKNPNDSHIQSLQVQLTAAQQNRNALQTQSAQLAAQHLAATNSVRVFQAASIPTSPDHPKPALNAAVGALIGLIIACIIVFLLEFFDDRIRTSEQLQALVGVSMLTTIRDQKSGDLLLGEPDVPQNAQLSAAFHTLDSNLSFIGFEDPLRTIVVTSAMPDEGKTTVAVNLAISMAQSGKRVLLVDADMHQPKVHQALGLPNNSGLSLWLSQSSSPTPVTSPEGMPNLFVLTAGPVPPNPSQLLGSSRMRELLTRSAHPRMGKVDVVVVDTPSLGTSFDGALVAAMSDGAILVADGTHLRATPLLRAKEALGRVNAKIIGLVLNHALKYQVANSGSYDYLNDIRPRTDDQEADGDLRFLYSHNSDLPAIDEVTAKVLPDDN